MLSIFELKKLEYQKMYSVKQTLTEYYKKNNANPVILDLVLLNNKAFGSAIEKIVIKRLQCEKTIVTNYDCTYRNIKIEIKSSRFWQNLNDFKWQHIMKDYDYDLILLVGVDFQEIKIYYITKQLLLDLFDKNIIKQQGMQGLWFTRKQVSNYIKEIRAEDDWNNLKIEFK